MFKAFISFSIFQKLLQQEKQTSKLGETARKRLLHDCRILHKQLEECNINFPEDPSMLPEASDLLATSDNRISLLLSEVTFVCHFLFSGILSHYSTLQFGPASKNLELKIRLLLAFFLNHISSKLCFNWSGTTPSSRQWSHYWCWWSWQFCWWCKNNRWWVEEDACRHFFWKR